VIEREWLAEVKDGDLSVRSLGKRHNCSHTVINARVKKYAWGSPKTQEIIESSGVGRFTAIAGRVDSPEMRGTVLDAISGGASIRVAAAIVGHDEKTIRDLRDKDSEFKAQIVQAQAEHAKKQLQRIDNAGATDWKAAEKLLQINPLTKEEFSQNQTPGGGTINIQINMPRPGDGTVKQTFAKVIDHE